MPSSTPIPTDPAAIAEALAVEHRRHAARMAELAAGLLSPLGYRIIGPPDGEIDAAAPAPSAPPRLRAALVGRRAGFRCPGCDRILQTQAAFLSHTRAKHPSKGR